MAYQMGMVHIFGGTVEHTKENFQMDFDMAKELKLGSTEVVMSDLGPMTTQMGGDLIIWATVCSDRYRVPKCRVLGCHGEMGLRHVKQGSCSFIAQKFGTIHLIIF